MRQIDGKEDFKDILYGDDIDLSKEDVDYKYEEDNILLMLNSAPYEGLMDKIRNIVDAERTEDKQTILYIGYENVGTWELGYVDMGLDLWRVVEGIFINYKPVFYTIEEDGLKTVNKLDYIHTVKLQGSELDGFIE